MERELSTLLWALAKSILERIEEHKVSGKLIPVQALYVKSEIKDLKLEKGSVSYSTSFANIEKEEWHWWDQHHFVEEVVKRIPEYPICVERISRRCQVSDQQADLWLSRFVQSIVSRAATGDADDGFLVTQVAIFCGDLDKAPVDWRISVWLNGIWLEDERYEVEGGMVLRRPLPSDFEVETRFESLSMISTSSIGDIPSAILEFPYRSESALWIQREVGRIVDALCLFNLGSVAARRTIMSARSVLQSGSMRLSQGRHVSRTYTYDIALADVDALQAFLGRMKPLLPSDPPDDSSTERPVFCISLDRYKDALLGQVPIESRITSAITCLEALYLKSEERMELSHRLSQRVSALLRLLGFKPLKVYGEISRAYEIRSTFIHGSQLAPGGQQSAADLCKAIMDYARISLIVFIQLQNTINKDSLINKLDNSLLDERALEKVWQLLGDNLLIPGGVRVPLPLSGQVTA